MSQLRTHRIEPETEGLTVAGGRISQPRSGSIEPGDIVNERFLIVREVGRGGMATVYLGKDLEDGREIALKVMHSRLTGSAKQRFTREFSTIASLRHPNLVEVFEYGETSDGPYFAMEYFEGATAAKLAQQPLTTILAAIYDLCAAIDFVHSKRIIHRDIKPGNILVGNHPTAGRFDVRLSDFGLAKFANTSSSLSGDVSFLGTLPYCAPEQILREELDYRADLYSLGMVVHELIAGVHPFEKQRNDPRSLISAQITTVPRYLRQIRDDISEELSLVVASLLSKDRNDRPVSAESLRQVIARDLGWTDRVASGSEITTNEQMGSRFVGREAEVAEIEQGIVSCLQPSTKNDDDAMPSRIYCVTGEAGMGKSTLVRRAVRQTLVLGGKVYEGRCFEGNAAPFQPFAEIIRQLLSEIDRVRHRSIQTQTTDLLASTTCLHAGDCSTEIDQVVEQYAPELLRIGPELRTLLGKKAHCDLYEHQRDSQYIYRALASFFLGVARIQPVCLVLEDLHWADRSTIDLVRHITREFEQLATDSATSRNTPRLAIVATSRAGEEYQESLSWLQPLIEKRTAIRLQLDAVSGDEVVELLSAILQSPVDAIDREIVDFVQQNCFGNPFYIAQTLREWRDYDSIQCVDRRWKFAIRPDSQSQVFATMRQAVGERLKKLGGEAKTVLAAAAVVGSNVEVDLLEQLCGDMGDFAFYNALDELLAHGALQDGLAPKQLRISHDLYREAAIDGLSKPRRERLHGLVGTALEERVNAGHSIASSRLAEHFSAAGNLPKGFTYFLTAAEEALTTQAYKDANIFLDSADRCRHENLTTQQSFAWELARGRAMQEVGHRKAALKHFRRAESMAETNLQLAESRWQIARNLLATNDAKQITQAFERSLQPLGIVTPKSRVGVLLRIMRLSALVLLIPRRIVPRSRRPYEEFEMLHKVFRDRLVYDLSTNVLGYALGVLEVAWIAIRSKDADFIPIALTKVAVNIRMCSESSYRLVRRSLKVTEPAQDPHRNRFSTSYHQANFGFFQFYSGNLSSAEKFLELASRAIQPTRDWYNVVILHFLRHSASLMGDAKRILTIATEERNFSAKIGDRYAMGWGMYGQVDALGRLGHCNEALRLADDAIMIVEDNYSRSVAHSEKARALLQDSQYGEAAEVAAIGLRMAFQDLFLNQFPLYSYALWCEGLIGPHWSRGPATFDRRQLRRAKWAEIKMRFWATQNLNLRAHSFRVAGRVAAARGKKKLAMRCFDRSLAAAKKFENHGEYARALIDKSLLVDGSEAAELRAEGLRRLAELSTVLPRAEQKILGIDQPPIPLAPELMPEPST
jgi:tetratricopeptide (TPR) repeat protein